MDSEPLTAPALEALRQWFRAEARDYPWSSTNDPYAIWISEVMLQQTVVSAAVTPYRAWMTRWPTLASLATAPEAEVLRAWEGLGYASRARNLHRAARQLVDAGQNTLPNTEAALRALPGVGEYTAAAVLSFAFHQSALTLDANLKRVFQRLDNQDPWTPELETRWRTHWAQLVTGATSRESNQAVMQLGQNVCRPRAPLCSSCPLAAGCRAHKAGTPELVPAPRERLVIEKATTVVFWHQGGRWWLARPLKGRFSNLWLAPPAADAPTGQRLKTRVHTYTKYRDTLTPWVSPWPHSSDPPLPPGWEGRWASAEEAAQLGMVSAYRRLLDEALSPRLDFLD